MQRLILLALLVVVFFWVFWFAPLSIGEFRKSPDGRYEARAENVIQGGFFGRSTFVKIVVLDSVTGREVWRIIRTHTPEDVVPDYGLRGIRYVTWAADSSYVTIAGTNAHDLKLPLP